jgi:hypothetical protein
MSALLFDRPPSTVRLVSIRTMQVALGAAWFFDGLLQLQPRMFTRAFVTQVLEPSAQGQPAWLARLVSTNAHLIAHDIAGWNVVFAAIQLLIGTGLIIRATVKPALVLSFVWSIGVWVLGEGFGMVLTGHTSALMGAPGAVVLYGVIGIVVWPSPARTDEVPPSSAREIAGRVMWAAVWVVSAVLWLMPANTSRGSIGSAITAMAAGEPSWLGHLDTAVGRLFATSGTTTALVLATCSAAVGLGSLTRRFASACLIAGAALSLTFWVFGQAFGGVLTGPATGTATDPGTGPILALLAFALIRVDPGRLRVPSTVALDRSDQGGPGAVHPPRDCFAPASSTGETSSTEELGARYDAAVR